MAHGCIRSPGSAPMNPSLDGSDVTVRRTNSDDAACRLAKPGSSGRCCPRRRQLSFDARARVHRIPTRRHVPPACQQLEEQRLDRCEGCVTCSSCRTGQRRSAGRCSFHARRRCPQRHDAGAETIWQQFEQYRQEARRQARQYGVEQEGRQGCSRGERRFECC